MNLWMGNLNPRVRPAPWLTPNARYKPSNIVNVEDDGQVYVRVLRPPKLEGSTLQDARLLFVRTFFGFVQKTTCHGNTANSITKKNFMSKTSEEHCKL